MKIENTDFGLRVTIPETEYSSEFVYTLRKVRVLNRNDADEQLLISELERREIPLIHQFMLRAWSMWNFFKNFPIDEGTGENNTIRKYFENWECHNRIRFTEYYHWGMKDLLEAINNISLEYCERSQHGWRF